MKSAAPTQLEHDQGRDGFPSASELAALRAWYAGLDTHAAVAQYLGHTKADGQSSRAMIGAVRRQLAGAVHARHREALATLIAHPAAQRLQHADAVLQALDILRQSPLPVPLVTDAVGLWLPPRTARALKAHGIKTLADLTVRVPRRRRWWAGISGLGATGARQVEAFFAAHPQLIERARALVPVGMHQEVAPWERLYVPEDVDGSRGTFRAPVATCTLSATNDYEAVQSWLALYESASTQRAYRKEAERLILWAVLERGRALSSLITDEGKRTSQSRAPVSGDQTPVRTCEGALPRVGEEHRAVEGAVCAGEPVAGASQTDDERGMSARAVAKKRPECAISGRLRQPFSLRRWRSRQLHMHLLRLKALCADLP